MSVPFDATAPWGLGDRVALRPERFGALAYHFGTRRLSFLKHPQLAHVVERLAEHDSAEAAMRAAGVSEKNRPAMTTALATLADTCMIVSRAA